MLADFQVITPQSGYLSKEIHRPETLRYALIDFITHELPRWRDDTRRPANTSETALTEYLCDHLNSVARMSSGWDIIQFRTEVVDERHKGRKIDLAPKPCGVTVWIGGRPYTQYEILLPIECKILPTPNGKATPKVNDRDEREYVINRQATTGGIQRFKTGHHGSDHTLGAMIAYVQKDSLKLWENRIAKWITELFESGQLGWTAKDVLHLEKNDKAQGIAVFRSSHARGNGLREIELRHLWLKMG